MSVRVVEGMRVAEIAVWFGGSLVELRHLATGSFRIGNGHDVDLAVVGLTSFPLVDWTDRGCVLRVPAGTTAWRRVDGVRAPYEGSLLAPGERVELAIGAVVIRIELIARMAALPRPQVELGWSGWVVGALIAHLLALVTIDQLADPEPEGIYVPSLASLLPQLPEPPPPPLPPDLPKARLVRRPAKRSAPAPAPRVTVVEPAVVEEIELAPEPAKRRARAVEGARRAGVLGNGMISGDQLRAITGTKDLGKELSDVGAIYREDEAEAKRFGGGRRFDPTKRDDWGTVDSGRYATVDRGRAAGGHYQLPGETLAPPQPRVAHCVGACTATGGLSREAIRTAIARYDEALLGCYERAGTTSRGDVVVELSIGEDGKVISSDGAGLGATGSCVAGVIRRVVFPRGAATTVRYPLSFSPS